MQIDVVKIYVDQVVCNLYTGDRCVRIVMTRPDYDALVRDGFFIRKGKTADSAGVWNTTKEYHQVEWVDGHRQLA